VAAERIGGSGNPSWMTRGKCRAHLDHAAAARSARDAPSEAADSPTPTSTNSRTTPPDASSRQREVNSRDRMRIRRRRLRPRGSSGILSAPALAVKPRPQATVPDSKRGIALKARLWSRRSDRGRSPSAGTDGRQLLVVDQPLPGHCGSSRVDPICHGPDQPGDGDCARPRAPSRLTWQSGVLTVSAARRVWRGCWWLR
jgi:hypothetical protein